MEEGISSGWVVRGHRSRCDNLRGGAGQRHLRLEIIIAVVAGLTVMLAPSADAMNGYHIGNSLTADSRPLALETFAVRRGHSLEVGRHLGCGTSLTYAWNNPYSTCITPLAPFGQYGYALGNFQFDYVTLQPARDAIFSNEVTSMLNFIDLTRANPDNTDTVFYIYSGWPTRYDYPTKWLAPFEPTAGATMTHTRQAYEELIAQVRASTDAQVHMIPVGEVLYQLVPRLWAGEVRGIPTVSDLYRDNYHLRDLLSAPGIGRYIASLTTYATIFGEDPTGLNKPAIYFGSEEPFTPEYYDVVHSTIWDVVSTHHFTGVPEPATITLLLGSALLLAPHRRQKKRHSGRV